MNCRGMIFTIFRKEMVAEIILNVLENLKVDSAQD